MFFIFISSYTEEVPQSTECCVMVFELTPKLFVSQALALYWNCKCVEMEEKVCHALPAFGDESGYGTFT